MGVARALTKIPTAWRLPEHCLRPGLDFQTALYSADAAVDAVSVLAHPSRSVFFLFGVQCFATVEPVPNVTDGYAIHVARYPHGGMADLVEQLEAQGYYDFHAVLGPERG